MSSTPRYNGPSLDEMTDAQKEIRDFILQSRPRTGLSGPFGPWLAVPAIARPASELGKACRYDTSLSFRESELVILLTGAKMKSATEFQIHTGEAMKAGMSMEQIDAIPQGDDFSAKKVEHKVVPLLKTEREKAIARFTAELLETCTVSVETYNNTKAVLDKNDSVLVEITSITGYYTYVSYTLNVFNIPAK
jgi:4-carboxymuconolactone decarboxylase